MQPRTKLIAIRIAWVAIALLAWSLRDPLHQLVTEAADASFAVRLLVYGGVYIAMAGFAIPGAVLLTILAGPLFGLLAGTAIASLASTVGATIAFIASRHYIFGSVNHQALRQFPTMGRWELLFLRLTPIMPFFAVNVLAGRSKLPIKDFWLISQLGMLPATWLLVRIGTIVPEVDQVTRLDMLTAVWPLLMLGVVAWCLRWWTIRPTRFGQDVLINQPTDGIEFGGTSATPDRLLAKRHLSKRLGGLLPLVAAVLLIAPGCTSQNSTTSLAAIYNPLAQLPDYERNPVIVIPGVLGSRLVDDSTDKTIWGKYDRIRFRRQQSEDLVAISVPMQEGVPLSELRDKVRSDGTLAYLELSIFGIPVELQAYNQILQTLGVGGYRDSSHPEADQFNYGDDHFTCFQFDYDWRRDVAENAAQLDKFIEQKRQYIQAQYDEKYGIKDADIKFDIVAHSLGGLVSRYYLRYGSQPLPEDGSLPVLDWQGAENVERVVLVGTPNAGSAFALRDLVNGHQLSRILPYYPPSALGTMPSIYQMLPRPRHRTLVDASDPEQSYDFYDPQLWKDMKWGLANPDEDSALVQLLPDAADFDQRQRIALDHQRKCLAKAKQLHEALDVVASPPPSVSLHLYAGDSTETPAVMSVDVQSGKIEVVQNLPGDDTTTRRSALMSELAAQEAATRPASPIQWSSVTFLPTSHRKLTSDPIFTNNILALLLQSPRRPRPPGASETSISEKIHRQKGELLR